jgi:hypothetical protein
MRSRRIKNSELVGDLLGSVAFTATGYRINPGLAATFPWLSVVANQWQQYRFHSLSFRFVTRTSTSHAGSVVIAPEYDPNQAAPETEAEATNRQDAVENVCWVSSECVLDPAAMFPYGPRKAVRSAMSAGGLSNYDAGTIYFCSTGEPDATAIGKIWVDYDCELFVPQVGTISRVPVNVASYELAAEQVIGTTNEKLLWTEDLNYLGVTYDSGDFTIPLGFYLVLLCTDNSYQSATPTTARIEHHIQVGGSDVIATRARSDETGGDTGAYYMPCACHIVQALNGVDLLAVSSVSSSASAIKTHVEGTRISFYLIA